MLGRDSKQRHGNEKRVRNMKKKIRLFPCVCYFMKQIPGLISATALSPQCYKAVFLGLLNAGAV